MTAASDKQPKKRFGKLPNSVARDPAIAPETLVLLAYRCTFVGRFALHEAAICSRKFARNSRPGICLGLGREVVRRGIRQAREHSLLVRYQAKTRRADGGFRFGRVAEEVHLPIKGGGFRIVHRAWFETEPKLSYKAMAAWIFIRACGGKGVFSRELANRFDWSRPTASRVLIELIGRGRIAAIDLPRIDGRFSGTRYFDSTTTRRTSEAKSPATGLTGDEDHVHLLIEEPSTSIRKGAAPPTAESLDGKALPPPAEATLDSVANIDGLGDKILLGWTQGNELVAALLAEVSDDMISASIEAVPDKILVEELRRATHDRIAPRLIAPDGLLASRFIALAFCAVSDEPLTAIASLLEAARQRIGQQPGEWLNSWQLVGARLAGAALKGQTDAAYPSPSARGRRVRLANIAHSDVAKASAAIRAGDTGELINPRLFRRTADLGRLLDTHGDLAVETILRVLKRTLMGGGPKSINTWRFFEGAIKDAESANELDSGGLRSGDLVQSKEPGPDDIPF